LFSLAVAVCAPTARAQDDLQPSGFVYAQTDDPAGNAILAYKRMDDGSVVPVKGMPFSTGGLGITTTFALGPFDSDQEVIVDPSHTFLFATNGGSDTIAVFRIAVDGSLTPVPGSPFPSGGSNPVSVGLADNILCVVNKDEDPNHPGQFLPNYVSFRVSPTGQLSPMPISTIFDPLGSDPSQALIAPGGRLMFGADFLGGLLRSFRISHDGRLESRAALPLPISVFGGTGKPPLPLGLAAHPEKPILYVGFVTVNKVGVYRFSKDGNLTFLTAVPDSGRAVCWLRVNNDGTRLYASNTGDPSISVFDIANDPTAPVEIQKVNLKSAPNSNAAGFQFELDPTNKFLQVISQQASPSATPAANALHVFSVGDDGKVTEVPSSPTVLPVTAGTRPQGVAAL
jgi:hypothetical protein